jgi:hypothetical protein
MVETSHSKKKRRSENQRKALFVNRKYAGNAPSKSWSVTFRLGAMSQPESNRDDPRMKFQFIPS